DAVILPGVVNAHTHLEYAVYAGFGDGMGDVAEWITLHVQRKARIGWEEYVDIARLGAALCLGSGVTTIGDCSYSGAAAVACAELGLRATVYLEVFGADVPRALEHFATIRDRAQDALSSRVRAGVSPHAPYSVSLELYQACAELGLPVATHISESASEVDYVVRGEGAWSGYRHLLVEPPGMTGTRLLAQHGLLGPLVLAARARARRPDVLTAAETLELATVGSARALGLDEEIGSLVPGKRADLAVVSLSGSPYLPWEDPSAAVVFGGAPDRVLATFV